MTSSVTLRQLRIFTEVARQGSLAAACRTLGLSRPTLSEALRDLEAALGRSLFDRGGRRLRPSPAGLRFLEDSARLVADADALVRRHSSQEHLAVGASVTAGNYLLPGPLVALRAQRPALEISVAVRNTEAIIQALLDGEIEAGLVEGQVDQKGLDVRPWRRDDQVIVARPDDPLARARRIDELSGAGWVLRERGSGTREAFDAAAAAWPFAPRIVMTVGGNELMKRAVSGGAGLGCLSRAAVRAELDSGELALAAVEGGAMQRTLSLVTLKGGRPQPALSALLALMRAEADPDFRAGFD